LPTALQLAHVQAADVLLAAERIQVAAALAEQAQVLWLRSWCGGRAGWSRG
jgi:hypothetical protein